MADPQIAARYVLDRCTPPEIREELERRLGARIGDSIALWSDGVVTLRRCASDEDAGAILPSLMDLSAPAVSRRARPGGRRRSDRAHLQVEK